MLIQYKIQNILFQIGNTTNYLKFVMKISIGTKTKKENLEQKISLRNNLKNMYEKRYKVVK